MSTYTRDDPVSATTAMFDKAIELLKVGAASTPIATTSMILLLYALSKIKIGTTTKPPFAVIGNGIAANLANFTNPVQQIEANIAQVNNTIIAAIDFLLGKPAPPASVGATLFTPAPDGTDSKGNPYWNVYALDPSVSAAVQTSLGLYLVGTGIGAAGATQQLGSLISAGVAAVK